MCENLRLPICPKCYETKTVTDGVCLWPHAGLHFHCTSCDITWNCEERGSIYSDWVNAKGRIVHEDIKSYEHRKFLI